MTAPSIDREGRAAQLLAKAWEPALTLSYRLGFENGRDAGRREAEQEMADAWAATARDVRAVLAQPRCADDAGPDFTPCAARCGACSRCICADAYRRRGGRDFLGIEREAELARGAA